MKTILMVMDGLYVDLETGYCGQELHLQKDLSVRLKSRQLDLLNILVNNRECLCEFRKLEDLLDAEPEDFRAYVRNLIRGIKVKFKEVNPAFDDDMAKDIFRSVSGRGYLFHMREGCRVICRRTPSDSMIWMNWEYLREQKKTGRQLEYIRKAFYEFTGDVKLILQAVYNDIHVSNRYYTKLLSALYKFTFNGQTPNEPVCILSEGGMGKTTLLCAFAMSCARNEVNWNVYYIDISELENDPITINNVFEFMCQNGISRTKKTVLFIDSPHDNPEVFRALYKKMTEEKNQYLYMVISERATYMLELLESDNVYNNGSALKAFILNDTLRSQEVISCIQERFDIVEFYPYSAELKASIAEEIITKFAEDHALDMLAVKQAREKIKHDGKTLADIYLDFKRNYNQIIRERGIYPENYHKLKITMDWDEWEKKCAELDDDCTRLKMSQIFPYLAVSFLAEIPCTFELIRSMTGYPYKQKLASIFPPDLGAFMKFDGEMIFRHDTVADNYFSEHREISPHFYLEDMIEQNYFDDASAERMAHLLIKLSARQRSAEKIRLKEYQIDAGKLISKYMKNMKYMQLLHNTGQADVIAIALILGKYVKNGTFFINEFLLEDVSDVFSMLLRSTGSAKKKADYWFNFYYLVEPFYTELPSSMLHYLMDSDEKQLSYIMESLLERYQLYSAALKGERLTEQKRKLLLLCDRLEEAGIRCFSLYFLRGKIYQELGQCVQALQAYIEAEEKCIAQKDKIELYEREIQCLQQILEYLASQSEEFMTDELALVIHRTFYMYETLRQRAKPEDEERYLIAALDYADFLMEHYEFQECEKIVEDTIREADPSTEGYYWLYERLTQLYGNHSEANVLYNPQKQLDVSRKMFDCYFKMGGYDEKMDEYINIVLIDAYLNNCQWGEAEALCRKALETNPLFSDIKKMLEWIMNRSNK